MEDSEQQLVVECPSFQKDGQMPKKHTGFGEDISPEFLIHGLSQDVVSVAIVMDDLDVPIMGEMNHWLIWNLPAVENVAEDIPHGATCPNGAVQGIGYGKNGYRGPKQPPFLKKAHRYRFRVYGLDCALDLPSSSKKDALTKAMSGHVLQSGEIIGWYEP